MGKRVRVCVCVCVGGANLAITLAYNQQFVFNDAEL